MVHKTSKVKSSRKNLKVINLIKIKVDLILQEKVKISCRILITFKLSSVPSLLPCQAVRIVI